MANPAEVATQVRFALTQLPSHNAHHTFEGICRHLTRQFICSNVLPATGPVSAGGDQGRDFETFRSYLARELGPHGGFLGLVSEGTVAFVCTIQTDDVAAKIAQDIAKVVASGHPVHEIKAFSLTSVPVAARHKLEADTRERHGIELDFFDAEAISELLATPEGFGIAEQFLALPAEVRPTQHPDEEDLPDWYLERRSKWREKRTPDPTLGDLIDLKAGLRHATFGSEAKSDLPFWLGLVGEMLANPDSPDDLQQRARYELVVATLRGTGDLRAVDDVARTYLDNSLLEDAPARLEDAVTLLTYAIAAVDRGLTAIEPAELWRWRTELKERVEHLMANATPSRRASLLFALGRLGLLPRLKDGNIAGALTASPSAGDVKEDELVSGSPQWRVKSADDLVDAELTMSAWIDLAKELDETPLFPVEPLSRFLELISPVLVDHEGWRTLVDLVDEAVARVSGSSAVAARAGRRAMKLLDAGRQLDGLAELHEAKISWWSGDTLRGSLEAMLTIARIYRDLRLPLAAKAHALAVAMVAVTSGDDDLADLAPVGILMAADADFASGAWCGSTALIEIGLAAQYNLGGSKPEFESEALGTATSKLTLISACARELDRQVVDSIREVTTRLGIRDIIDETIADDGSPADGGWGSFLPSVLTSPPFSDLGATRYIRFSALGTDWTVECKNELDSVRAAERFAAAAQVMLAELAREDLCILPSRITVQVHTRWRVAQRLEEDLKALPSNDGRLWEAHLTPISQDTNDPHLLNKELLAMLTQILLEASLLPAPDFVEAIDRAFQGGLAHKLSPARPYDELAAMFWDDQAQDIPRGIFETKWDCLDGTYDPHSDLMWQDGPGPTFTSAKAEELLRSRYDVFASSLRVTVPALGPSFVFGQIVKVLRREGWLDWHLLLAIANIVLNYRQSVSAEDFSDPTVREEFVRASRKPEEDTDPPVPVRMFTREAMQDARRLSMLSSLANWDLECRQPTPDFPAIERFLAARYGYWGDDVEHEDPFPEAH
ncbi:MAG: hypothetical protein F4Y50_05105 [Dehalococcoidia bacterium]|nr:hypothetical protein [Dehalococcoidia bacterium]